MALTFRECHLEELLDKKDMSKAELSRRMKVTRSTVTKWCNLQQIMSLSHALEVCKVFGCNINDIYTYE